MSFNAGQNHSHGQPNISRPSTRDSRQSGLARGGLDASIHAPKWDGPRPTRSSAPRAAPSNQQRRPTPTTHITHPSALQSTQALGSQPGGSALRNVQNLYDEGTRNTAKGALHHTSTRESRVETEEVQANRPQEQGVNAQSTKDHYYGNWRNANPSKFVPVQRQQSQLSQAWFHEQGSQPNPRTNSMNVQGPLFRPDASTGEDHQGAPNPLVQRFRTIVPTLGSVGPLTTSEAPPTEPDQATPVKWTGDRPLIPRKPGLRTTFTEVQPGSAVKTSGLPTITEGLRAAHKAPIMTSLKVHPRDDFYLGLIILAPFHEQDDFDVLEAKKHTCQSQYGPVHSKIRKMIVGHMREETYHAVPLYSHEGNGLANKTPKRREEFVSIWDHRLPELQMPRESDHRPIRTSQFFDPDVDFYHPKTTADLAYAKNRKYHQPCILEGRLSENSTRELLEVFATVNPWQGESIAQVPEERS